ncbi:MAG: hypothetical protein QXN86_02225 [Candidatus Methanomethylicaceae archaeon]
MNLQAELRGTKPLENPDAFRKVIWNYLKPRNGRPAPRAHLFTINGLTYPVHRDFSFAAVPDPHEVRDNRVVVQRSKRRYSMLAYLFSVRRGDLLFFFQADPQGPGASILDRRGFRGIWVVASEPFRDTTDIKLPSGYEVLGACPHCRSPFDFGEGSIVNGAKCSLCGNRYGEVNVSAGGSVRAFSRVVLSTRILIEPLVLFQRTAGDNRVYSDMTLPPLIWISRTDNAMGPGKGSSIRTLLPEEAAKVAYMLATEDGQRIIDGNRKQYPGLANPITDHNGVDAKYPRLRNAQEVEHELQLNLYFSRKIDDPGFSLTKDLELPLERMEYWTTEFPWGYTGDTADFVAALWDDEKGRYKAYLFEFKKACIDKSALAETLLYIPWVAQVLLQFRPETPVLEVVPVMVGSSVGLRALPNAYSICTSLFPSGRKTVNVLTPRVFVYTPVKMFKRGNCCYAQDLEFRETTLPRTSFSPPPPSFTTSAIERQWVIETYLSGF